MNNLQVFKFEGNQIRTVLKDGVPWWVLTDVCKQLGISNTTTAAKRLDQDERSKFNLGRQGDALIVNEFGLYRLLFRSDKKEAQPFIRWVTHEVLPQIRKTGAYMTEPNIIEEMNDAKLTVEQRISIGSVLAQCQQHSLSAVLDLFSPYLSPGTRIFGTGFPKVPVTLQNGGTYIPPGQK